MAFGSSGRWRGEKPHPASVRGLRAMASVALCGCGMRRLGGCVLSASPGPCRSYVLGWAKLACLRRPSGRGRAPLAPASAGAALRALHPPRALGAPLARRACASEATARRALPVLALRTLPAPPPPAPPTLARPAYPGGPGSKRDGELFLVASWASAPETSPHEPVWRPVVNGAFRSFLEWESATPRAIHRPVWSSL